MNPLNSSIPFEVELICDRLNYCDPFEAEGTWWAFPPNAVMAVPLNVEVFFDIVSGMSRREFTELKARHRWERGHPHPNCQKCHTGLTWENHDLTDWRFCEACSQALNREAEMWACRILALPLLLFVIALSALAFTLGGVVSGVFVAIAALLSLFICSCL